MNQISRDNHFVPQSYLKQWSNDGLEIWAYRILVSHTKVPEWTKQSIKQVAFLRDLYTEIVDGEEVDEFENWLATEFEYPVQKSIAKVVKDNPLNTTDWERLAKFLGAQDLRTLYSYLESSERWEKTLPKLLKNTMEKALNKKTYSKANKNDTISIDPSLRNAKNEFFEDLVEFEILSDTESGSKEKFLQGKITVGRKFWLQSQRYALINTISALKQHKWCIAYPARGHQWFTSDHPVVKLNFYGDGSYDLKGGWGNKGTNIFMPLSPRHLLFTEIGKDVPDRLTFSSERTKELQRFLAERAMRWIFADRPLEIIGKFRPRHINAEIFKREREEMENWHDVQRENRS